MTEGQQNEENSATIGGDKKPFKKPWPLVARIIDRCIFLSLTIVYLIMVLALIPEDYLSRDPRTGNVVVTGE